MISEIDPLVMPFDKLIVTTSKREYREVMRDWGAEPAVLSNCFGNTSTVDGEGCVVWISKKVKGSDLCGLAAHEAVHAAMDLLAMIGENSPADEELAYMVQTITVGILDACTGAKADSEGSHV